MPKITSSWFEEHIIGVDGASKRAGVFTLRRGYFYRDTSAGLFKASITSQLDELNVKYEVIETGDRWAAFKGGAPLAQQSHFYVKLKVLD